VIIIWGVLGIVLVVMVLGGFVGRARTRRQREDEALQRATHPHHDPHHPPHHKQGHGGDATPARRSKGHH
jgi:hypothetical protein